MALAADHFPFGLARLSIKSRPLTVYPPKLADYRQSHGIIIHSKRSRHPDTAIGRIYTQVQVLDVLPDNFNPQAIDANPAMFSTHADFSPAQESRPQQHQ
jgi:hypothetical protein